MASKLDIWNLALSHLGHKARITDPDEPTVEAAYCRQYYPIALEMLLEQHAWSFATRRVALASVDNTLTGWAFAYGLPNPCAKVWAVLMPNSTDDTATQPFTIELDNANDAVIYTDVDDAVLLYSTVPTDTATYPASFVFALSLSLASLMTGTLIVKDTRKTAALEQRTQYYTRVAMASDKNSSLTTINTTFTPSFFQGR